MTRELLVGAVFMLAVCLIAFGTIAVSGFDVFTPKVTWYVELTDLSGLQVGDQVRVLGHRMGSVRRVRFDQKKHLFRLSLRMQAEAPIHGGYRIAVRESSALGGKYLSVNPGDPDQPMADIERLAGEPTPDLMTALADILAEFKKAVTTVGEGRGTLGQLIYKDELYRDAKDMAASLRTVAKRLEEGKGSFGKFLKEDEIYENVRQIVAKLNKGDSALAKLMKPESGAVVDDLKAAVASIKSVAAKADTGSGTLAKLFNESKLYDETNATVTRANSILKGVEDGKGVAGMLLSDPAARKKLTALVDDAAAAAADVKVISENARVGKGSLGKFLKEEEFYDNVNASAKHIKSVAAKVDKGDGTVGRLVNDPSLYQDVKRLLARAIDSIENARDSAPVSAIASFIIGPFQ